MAENPKAKTEDKPDETAAPEVVIDRCPVCDRHPSVNPDTGYCPRCGYQPK